MPEFEDWLYDAGRELDREEEELTERAEQIKRYRKAFEIADGLLSENKNLKEQLKEALETVETLRLQLKEMETKLGEMNKLASGVAKKSSPDDVAKALRIYLNTSKRKTLSKREAAKTVLLELIAAAKLELPEELMEVLNHFDDEQPEAKVVNVQGDYNDIHNNGTVNNKG